MTKFCSGGIEIESWSSIGTYEPHSAWRNRAAQQSVQTITVPSVQTITVPQDTMPYDTMPHGITVPHGISVPPEITVPRSERSTRHLHVHQPLAVQLVQNRPVQEPRLDAAVEARGFRGYC